jgi:hypothetical protein
VGLRDRVVLVIVVGGVLAVLAVARLAGAWPALVLGLLVVVAAGVAYRVEPPRLPPPAPDDARPVAAGRAHEPAPADGGAEDQ